MSHSHLGFLVVLVLQEDQEAPSDPGQIDVLLDLWQLQVLVVQLVQEGLEYLEDLGDQ